MRRYIIKRLILFIPVVIGVVTFVFLIIHLIPGDPVDMMLGETAQQADKEILRIQLGLTDPIYLQYYRFIKGVVSGDLGISIHFNQPVIEIIIDRFPATLELTLGAMVIAILISIPLGIIAASRQYSIFDNTSMLLALVGISMPNFWLGPLLIILFSIDLGWLPVSGKEGLTHLILPSITLGTSMSAILSRMTRSSLLEVIREDYITAARAKGLSEGVIMVKHALTNALLPIITIIGLQFGSLLAGSIITETIFSWPGVGRLTIQSIITRDYPLVQGCVLFIALCYVVVNL
ncbi:MAG: ABC transporter permease, partial [Nitrospinae bacterium]|nr:ABC transporter permease [Nitrospinota bacterium]